MPHRPQRKVRQKCHFSVLSRAMLGNLPGTISKMKEDGRPAYTADRTCPQHFRRAQHLRFTRSSQHFASGEQSTQSSKVTRQSRDANPGGPHPCAVHVASWRLSLSLWPSAHVGCVCSSLLLAPNTANWTWDTHSLILPKLEFPLLEGRLNDLLRDGKPMSQRSLWSSFTHTRSCS